MRRIVPVLSLSLALTFSVLAVAGFAALRFGSSDQAQAATSTVNIGDDFYTNTMSNNCGSPCVTNIGVNDTVHWVWLGGNQHSTTSDVGSPQAWDSDQHGNGFTFDQTFTQPGTYNYHCTVHSNMHGRIVVGGGAPTPTRTPTEPQPPGGTPTRTPTRTPTLTPQDGNIGDVNCSGIVDSIDAALELQYGAGLLGSFSCPENADADANGTINSIDAALILQYGAGLVTSLPPH